MRADEWKVCWVVALVVLGVGMAGWEHAFAALGGRHQSVVDDDDLWADWRARASSSMENDLILVGASRMQLDIDVATLERATGMRVVQLAIDGTSFLPVLIDLAADDGVKGNVLVSVRPADLTGQGVERAERAVRHYHARQRQALRSPAIYLERKLKAWLARILPSRAQGVRPGTLFALWRGERRVTGYLTTYSTREREADYSRTDAVAMRERRLTRSMDWYRNSSTADSADVTRTIASIGAAVQTIEARGGRVVFVRLPVSQELLAASEAYLPDANYLGRLVRETGVRLVDVTKHDATRGFALPDGSHLDRRDQVAFTTAFARLLAEQGALPAP